MPIYEYKCNECKAEFELLVNMNAEPGCPECSSKILTKKFSTFGISTGSVKPDCATGCGGGFQQGSCGSGMCGGH